MRARQCGTVQLPADGTADREVIDQFALFLQACQQRTKSAVLADPAWQPYIAGEGPAPVEGNTR